MPVLTYQLFHFSTAIWALAHQTVERVGSFRVNFIAAFVSTQSQFETLNVSELFFKKKGEVFSSRWRQAFTVVSVNPFLHSRSDETSAEEEKKDDGVFLNFCDKKSISLT